MNCATLYAVAAAIIVAFGSVGNAQLQITEILYDTKTVPEGNWEWFEVYNAGSTDIDLDGYVFDDRSTSAGRTSPNILSLVGNATVNTVVPAKTAAVVYNGGNLDFDESRFRSAWKLGSSVPLIGVDGWQSLNQGGDAFGLWDSIESYESDLANTDEDEDLEVSTFDSALTWIDYGVENFPNSPAGVSVQWNNTGDYRAAENWAPSEEGSSIQSVATQLAETAVNDTSDIGNPGLVVGSTAGFNSLAITEIMYNPASSEPDWEWIEIYNGSGEAIDFSATPHFFDDKASADMPEPNVNSGSVAAGGTAILFSGEDIFADDMSTAWGEGNYISVADWPSLNNGGDIIGIWNDADEYAIDGEAAGDRRVDRAVFAVSYLDGEEEWPNVGQGNSISLLDLSSDAGVGTNWSLSTDGDGDSSFAQAVISTLDDHAGGDLGTPGTIGEVDVQPPTGLDINGDGAINADDALLLCSSVGDPSGLAAFLESNGGIQADFDMNGSVDFTDFLVLSNSFGATDASYAMGDANCSGEVEFADFLILSANFGQTASGAETGSSVPEPSGTALLMAAGLFLTGLRRRRMS